MAGVLSRQIPRQIPGEVVARQIPVSVLPRQIPGRQIPGRQIPRQIPGQQVMALHTLSRQIPRQIPGEATARQIPSSVLSRQIPGRQIPRQIPGQQVAALHTSAARKCGAGPIYDDVEGKMLMFGEEVDIMLPGGASVAKAPGGVVRNVTAKMAAKPMGFASAGGAAFGTKTKSGSIHSEYVGTGDNVMKSSGGAPAGLHQLRNYRTFRDFSTMPMRDPQGAIAQALLEEHELEKNYVREWIRSTYKSGFRDPDAIARSKSGVMTSEDNAIGKADYPNPLVRSVSQGSFKNNADKFARTVPANSNEQAFIDACWDYFDFRQKGAIEFFEVQGAYQRRSAHLGMESAGESVARFFVESGLAETANADTNTAAFTPPMIKSMDLLRAVKTGQIKLDENNHITGPELSRWALRVVDLYNAGTLTSNKIEEKAALHEQKVRAMESARSEVLSSIPSWTPEAKKDVAKEVFARVNSVSQETAGNFDADMSYSTLSSYMVAEEVENLVEDAGARRAAELEASMKAVREEARRSEAFKTLAGSYRL